MQFTKKIFIKILLTFFLLFSLSLSVFSHQIPREIVEFIANNPNATELEFENFIAKDPTLKGFSRTFDESILDQEENPNEFKDSFFQNFKNFIYLGFTHILSWFDHVLFVISFILIFMPWSKILFTASIFTLAHSTTIFLSAFWILNLSSKIVEPFIALSIWIMAIYNVFFRKKEENFKIFLWIIFFFWLFHWLWFAWVLNEISISKDLFLSSLLSFNLWVEFWQILIILILLPWIRIIFKHKKWEKIIKLLWIFIFLTSIFYFIKTLNI